MVVKMMRWRPWPPIASRKLYEVRLVVLRLDGLGPAPEEEESAVWPAPARLTAEVRWKGPKVGLGAFRRTVKRNLTKEERLGVGGVVEWREEFQSVCALSLYRENGFHPWEIDFTVFGVTVFSSLFTVFKCMLAFDFFIFFHVCLWCVIIIFVFGTVCLDFINIFKI